MRARSGPGRFARTREAQGCCGSSQTSPPCPLAGCTRPEGQASQTFRFSYCPELHSSHPDLAELDCRPVSQLLHDVAHEGRDVVLLGADVSEEYILRRYDGVIHMVTAADGAPAFYR